MIHITDNTLHIILPHPCPEEALQDLQQGIIESLQLQYEHPKNIGSPTQEENNANYMLLELLKATLTKEMPKEVWLRYLDKEQAQEIAETFRYLSELILPDQSD